MPPTIRVLAALGLACALLATPAARASEPKTITWADLAPAPMAYENPFQDLAGEDLDALRRILRIESGAAPDAAARNEAAALRADLAARGLDADGLFAKRLEIIELRQQAMSATNDAVLGRQVRMPGYVLPLELRDRKVVEFLLVPTVGACIHTPPPPPNQIVHVRYPEGFEVQGLFAPVWIIGAMTAETRASVVGYVDGQGRVETGYAMRADLVAPY